MELRQIDKKGGTPQETHCHSLWHGKDSDMVNNAQITQYRRSRPFRVLPLLCHLGRSRMIYDLRRDWRRWTRAERAFAPVIAAILLIVIPTTILMTV